MNYFICDIVGTFDGCDNNREESILKFINNLHRMMEIDGIDSLTFCFSSSSDMDEIKKYIAEFNKYLNGTKIIMGQQFSHYQVLNDKKVSDTLPGKFDHAVDMLKNKKVDNLYIADDTLAIQELYEELLIPVLKHKSSEEYHPIKNMVQLIPGMEEFNGTTQIGSSVTSLLGLNECLEKYINKRIKQKSIEN